jgi:tetratricopeptide (TPR) repeat protein
VQEREPLEVDFLLLLARTLFEDQRWTSLQACLARISEVGSSMESDLLTLYRGLALAGMGQAAPALFWLRAYLEEDVPDVFPGAAAAAWLRLAELQLAARHSGVALPLDAWARAMCGLPRRTAELLPRFLELGERSLQAENRSLEIVYDELAMQGWIVPRIETNPFLLYGLAGMHLERKAAFQARALTEVLLQHYPDFVPAIDLEIQAELELFKRDEAAENYVRRLELTGPDERTAELEIRFAAYPFSDAQRVRRMEGDPEGIGRRTVARRRISHGDRTGALRALRPGRRDERSIPELRMLAGLLLEEGRYELALAELERVPPEDRAFLDLAPMLVEAALALGRADLARAAAAQAVAGGDRDKTKLLALGTALLRLGEAKAAKEVLRLLDAGRARDGHVLMLLGMASLAANDAQAAQAYLDRAEAFVRPELAALARALAAARLGDGFTLEREIRELYLRGHFPSGPLQAAAAVISGEPERTIAAAGGEQSADWQLVLAAARASRGEVHELPASFGRAATAQLRRFVRGTELSPADPRIAMLFLLGLGEDSLAAYVAGELHGADPATRGSLWPRLLEARALARLGLHSQARLSLGALVGDFPDCQPAWAELETSERARLRRFHHPELVELRARHLRVQGEARPESPEGLLLRARAAFDEGRMEAASLLSRRALEERPDWDEALATLAAALSRRGSPEALEVWAKALTAAPAERAPALVDGFLAALAAAQRAGGIEPTAAFQSLQTFARALPDDPLLALALARHELSRDERNPSLGYSRALARLETFRLQHAALSLDDLSPGTTAAWANFYLGLDPLEGERFLLAERLRDPGNLELWVLLGRVQARLGRIQPALELLARAARMVPEARVFHEIAALQAASGAEPRLVRSTLDLAREPRSRHAGVAGDLLVARTRLRQLKSGATQTASQELEPLWQERESLGDAERRELAQLWVQAGAVAEWKLLEGDPYRLDLADALLGLTTGSALRAAPAHGSPPAEPDGGAGGAPAATEEGTAAASEG